MKFLGAVLAGGASSRFGADKSLALFGGGPKTAGKPLAQIAFGALTAAGAEPIWSVGGDEARLSEMGFVAVPDDHPNQGPLGGIITAMRCASQIAGPGDAMFVLACDLPRASAQTLGELLATMQSRPSQRPQVVFPLDAQQRIQYLHGLWRLDTHQLLRQAFDDGQRSVAGGLEYLDADGIVTQQVSDPDTLVDADTPADLLGS